MAQKNITVKDFIEDYLIAKIGEIKDDQPYFAFVLMAIGIEFLGKCQNNVSDWNYYTKGQPKRDFNKGMKLAPLKKYKSRNLYDSLRCGLAHSLSTKGLALSDKKNKKSISCDEFYADFVAACNEVLSGRVPMPKKNLSDIFFVETISNDGSSTTGHSQSNQVQPTK